MKFIYKYEEKPVNNGMYETLGTKSQDTVHKLNSHSISVIDAKF